MTRHHYTKILFLLIFAAPLAIGVLATTSTGSLSAEVASRKVLTAPGFGRLFTPQRRMANPTRPLGQSGVLDPTFGNGGKLTDWGVSADGVAIQRNGKIVVVGSGPHDLPAGEYGFRVARYDPDGTPDTTFGNGTGRVATYIGRSRSTLGVLIQPDGKLVVAGSVESTDGDNFALVRYKSDGSLDPQFGGGTGIVMTRTPENCGIYSYFTSVEIAIQPDGRLIGIVGYDDWDGNCNWPGLLFRYLPDGSIDTAFGNNGIVFSEGEWGAGALWSLAIQPSDGKIVVSGYRFVRRFNTNGSADTSFGEGGIVTIPEPAFVLSVAVQQDGKILAGGSSSTPEYDFAVFRFNGNGTSDTSFGNGGVATSGIGSWGDWIQAIATQTDGKVVAFGVVSYQLQGSDFGIARFNPDGSRDQTYGCCGQGTTVIDFNNSDDFARNMALDRAGRAVVVGRSNGEFAIARVLSGLPEPKPPAPFDYDGDGKTDFSVYRPSNGNWYVARSQTGDMYVRNFWSSAIYPADYDGDGKTDPATTDLYDNVPILAILPSSVDTVWGLPFDVAGNIVVADFDGDGKADPAGWADGLWQIVMSRTWSVFTHQWGVPGDRPVPADFDGDGRAELVVWRPSEGRWYVLNLAAQTIEKITWGVEGDIPVVGDYSGDGRADFAVYRPSNNTWYRLISSDFSIYKQVWGMPNDKLTPGDYDGDGRMDLAIFRQSESKWYVLTAANGILTSTFGIPGDLPTPGAFIY